MTENGHSQALEHPIFKTLTACANELGCETYVIGGFVRDYLLERGTPKDIDIVVVGSGIALAKKLSEKLPHQPEVTIFKNYGTAMIKYQDLVLEFVGARKESYRKESRNPVVEIGSLQEDQNRRDFTINALAIGLNQINFGRLIDPFNGLKALKDKRIITPLEPDETFSDDPLRMLRAIRFASQLNFKIAPEALAAIKRNKGRIAIISKERIVEEIHKMLGSQNPTLGFSLMHKTGLLPLILPELSALEGIEEVEGQKHKDNFWHTLEVVENICKNTGNIWLRWAALLHDIGKAPTKRFNKKIGWTFHGHEFVGAKMVYKIFKRLHMPLNEKMKYVQKMVLMSARPIVLAEDFVTDAAVRRLVFDAGEYVEDLMTLCEADITTKNPFKKKKYQNNFLMVRQKIEEVEARDHIRNFQPPVSGKEIMSTFGLKPSKEIGLIKEAIKEAILEGDIPNEHQAAYAFMLQKGAALGLTKANK